MAVETRFGRHKGKYRAFNSLASIALGYTRRSAWAERELLELLLMYRDQDPLEPLGSYAGAIGYPQFMPSNIRRFGVDADKDGKVDLSTWPDAIMSCANYLKHYGWKKGGSLKRGSRNYRAVLKYNPSHHYARVVTEAGNLPAQQMVNDVFEATVEPHLIQPTFVKDYPAELCPLTRRKADDPTIALRFELFIAGMEIANAYTELNDPAVQEENFRLQLAGEGDGQSMRVMDEDFLTALRHGMPPAGGLGIGIDRVVMLLTGRTSIRDVILFPMLRPQDRTEQQG